MFTSIEFAINGAIGLLTLLPQVLYSYRKSLYQPQSISPLTLYHSTNLTNKIVIITGSNTGIGKETAKTLALLGATVILACRDETKGLSAVKYINAERLRFVDNSHQSEYSYAKFGKVSYKNLDLSSIKSIYEFAEVIKSSYDHIDVLINNAGVNISGQSKDNMEQLFQINYLGHFLLFVLLKALLYKSNDGRVVNLSSVMHHVGSTSFLKSDYYTYRQSKRYDYYSDSKLYMNLFTLEINRRFKTISAVSCNPGAVRSDIWRHVPSYVKGLYDIVMRMLYLSVEQGSLTSIHAATLSKQDIIEYNALHYLSECDDKTGSRWIYHPLIPYIIPYYIPIRLLCFEMFGPLNTPHYGEISMPAHGNKIAEKLWESSQHICLKRLQEILDEDKFMEIKTLFE